MNRRLMQRDWQPNRPPTLINIILQIVPGRFHQRSAPGRSYGAWGVASKTSPSYSPNQAAAMS